MSHPNLAYVDSDALEFELRQSKVILEERLESPVRHFAYPRPALQPHWSRESVALCRKLGYYTSVTTVSGPVEKGQNPLLLSRVSPGGDAETLRWNLECTFLGRAM